MTSASPAPRLLVSVRSAAEALCAANGGANIIDFKDPDRGSLGRLDGELIYRAVAVLQGVAASGGGDPPLSVALGEVQEFSEAKGDFPPMSLPPEIRFAKLGLAGLGTQPDWVDMWMSTRASVEAAVGRRLDWVAVAYADVEEASAPPIEAVAAAAHQTCCSGVLIDTFGKSDGRLFDYVKTTHLSSIAQEVQRLQMFFAVAGRLRAGDIELLREVRPDIVAVRSAVCDDENRRASVRTTLVSSIANMLRTASTHRPSDSGRPTLTATQSVSDAPHAD